MRLWIGSTRPCKEYINCHLSIRKKRFELIASGHKSIEVRKSAPKEVPFKAYIYQTEHKCGSKIINDVMDSVYSGGKLTVRRSRGAMWRR